MCQVEVILDDIGGPMAMMSNPSVMSSVFTAGMVVNPSLEVINVYKNGSVVNITLTTTMPFTCAAHINPHDCHLTVQVVQPEDSLSQTVAISKCQISMSSDLPAQSQYFLVVPVADFVRTSSKSATVIQLVVSSYGDAGWHGYQLPNITIQVI